VQGHRSHEDEEGGSQQLLLPTNAFLKAVLRVRADASVTLFKWNSAALSSAWSGCRSISSLPGIATPNCPSLPVCMHSLVTRGQHEWFTNNKLCTCRMSLLEDAGFTRDAFRSALEHTTPPTVKVSPSMSTVHVSLRSTSVLLFMEAKRKDLPAGLDDGILGTVLHPGLLYQLATAAINEGRLRDVIDALGTFGISSAAPSIINTLLDSLSAACQDPAISDSVLIAQLLLLRTPLSRAALTSDNMWTWLLPAAAVLRPQLLQVMLQLGVSAKFCALDLNECIDTTCYSLLHITVMRYTRNLRRPWRPLSCCCGTARTPAGCLLAPPPRSMYP
jgi:hypothetical protein